MSYDMSVSWGDEDGDGGHLDINWLRNPFGLCTWAEWNVGGKENLDEWALYDVCNQWAYDKVKDFDRDEFHRVVMTYADRVRSLEIGYYVFDVFSYIQFCDGHFFKKTQFGSIMDAKAFGRSNIGIPMEFFESGFNLGRAGLEGAKEWFEEFVAIAEAVIKHRDSEIHISN